MHLHHRTEGSRGVLGRLFKNRCRSTIEPTPRQFEGGTTTLFYKVPMSIRRHDNAFYPNKDFLKTDVVPPSNRRHTTFLKPTSNRRFEMNPRVAKIDNTHTRPLRHHSDVDITNPRIHLGEIGSMQIRRRKIPRVGAHDILLIGFGAHMI